MSPAAHSEAHKKAQVRIPSRRHVSKPEGVKAAATRRPPDSVSQPPSRLPRVSTARSARKHLPHAPDAPESVPPRATRRQQHQLTHATCPCLCRKLPVSHDFQGTFFTIEGLIYTINRTQLKPKGEPSKRKIQPCRGLCERVRRKIYQCFCYYF